MIRRNTETPEQQVGDIGENAVAKYLRKKGYKILERNYFSGKNEVDLIVSKEHFIAFVEVKTRTVKEEPLPDWQRPCLAVDKEKRRCLILAAKNYIKRGIPGYQFRFDVAEVYLTPLHEVKEIHYMERAFTA